MAKKGPCKHLAITPDADGKVRFRANSVHQCKVPLPALPALPASITKHYSFTWPPLRSFVGRVECEGCPLWEDRK